MLAVLFSGFVALVFLWAVVEAWGWSFEARLFPWIVGFPMLLLALVRLARDLRRPPARADSRPDGSFAPGSASGEPELPPALLRARTTNILAWIFGFFLAVWLIGFSLSMAAFLFLYLKWESGESWGAAVLLTLAGSLFFYGLFERALHLPLPQGEIFAWLAL